ncbi:(2Fe-2S)-binding protein [candidate division bacterium WOR-3 4484_18]|uniref:(2Fe-2S)-binding protein n=1 Tax=candidate division WOR-3 bacterium 4484_18 TaxID=2020626 RepID=A0A257LV46_UNCW3|nr:MAG: (2Fe-2S)-binding protein [candidate division bacterium WOR-3 4484_18]
MNDRSKDTKIICRCEDLTEDEIIKYIEQGYHTLEEIKRASRAGMGHCQGRTCQRLIAQIISKKLGIPLENIKPPTARPPIKPIPLKVTLNLKRKNTA